MKFNLVNDNKLQIIVSREDMVQRDIHKWDLVPHNPEAQKLFQEILEEAHEACGFDVGKDAQLMIEAYPITGDSMLITVTKLGGGRSGLPFDLDLDSIGQALMEELIQDEDLPEIVSEEVVVRFAQLDDAIEAAIRIAGQYDGVSQLLLYEDRYYLALLEKEWLTDSGIALLAEYGDVIHTAAAFFQEHGTVVMDENALDILSNL